MAGAVTGGPWIAGARASPLLVLHPLHLEGSSRAGITAAPRLPPLPLKSLAVAPHASCTGQGLRL